MTHGIVCTLMVANLERILHQPRHRPLTGKPLRHITVGRCAWVLREFVKMFTVPLPPPSLPPSGHPPAPQLGMVSPCEAERA
jgi:hypothetical protein